jgi:TonB-linked SusC/RagA family outer membrane protein
MKNKPLAKLKFLGGEIQSVAKISTLCLLFSASSFHSIANVIESPAIKVAGRVVQQTKKITGVVTDSNGEAVIGANVVEKGTTNGTVTDLDGKYELSLPSNAILQVSYIGYMTKEIPIRAQSVINITIGEDTQALEEVVVVGYGVQRKSDVTGSISVTKAEDMLKQQSFSALDGLKGKSSGVNIFSNSGQPGGASRVIIRGVGTINSSSEPLYVVDGVVMEDFKFLNPNDIERIEVLKDASSTAIYGARGANGVIMVTTKRGTKGQGTQISYSGSVSLGTMANYMDVMNSGEYFEAINQSFSNANNYYGKNISLNMSDHYADPDLFNADGTPKYDTDWQRESTRNALSHNHQINITQGTENSSVGAFLNYTDQQGLLLNSYMKRINAKLAYDAKPTKWLSTGVNVLVNHTWANEAEEGGGGNIPRRSMIEMVPFMPVQFPDGKWSNSTTVTDNLGLEGMANPVHVLETQQRMRYRTQIFGNAALTFHLLPGLDLKTQLGIDSHVNKSRDYSPKDLINISFPDGTAYIKDANVLYWQEETYLTYMKNVGLLKKGI